MKCLMHTLTVAPQAVDGREMRYARCCAVLLPQSKSGWYFTRRSHDYSSGFGATADEGSLTQYIAKSFRSHVKSCILDGESFCELEKAAGGKLATATVGYDEDDGGSPAKKRRIGASVKVSLGTHFRPANLSGAVKKRSILQGKELCILTGCGDVTKQELEVQVDELGGTFVQNPSKETFCVVAEKLNFRARSIINRGKWDVVKADKFLALLNSPELRPWEPADLWCSCTETENRLKSLFDEYGDSYTAPVTASSLQELFATIPKEAWNHVDDLPGFIFNFEQENFDPRPTWGLFRNCTLRLSEDSKINRLIIRLHGGKVLNTLGDGEVGNSDFDLNDMNTSEEVLEVDSEWIDECIRAGELPLFS
ncbi:hypothetical protein HPB49_001003 [Dermacentor silvarum]|uniref:Uncharacterized protein n=1 Tax=Dermacentor silvarum TaxID=543639 RepID=A0ACB8D1X0_DERSI|nr:hypothetical protein HPB49_001003 [Dermacentor silvarum]